ncbi:site-specific DNA-methyltransferase [Leifsonia sp. 1010]|uniref:site-specific DNA-methyltransferase n=1 Tax=Leifsonia sp. 1010 TaxID=2817769 RepID=UPI002856AC0D|nr:site-specific DNA-methyltransferase [Leifsonia sp. 1010]MDR6613807.1 adenine-specific DNA-methyltransferase [Leifsonia sp. 1010]
MTDFVPGETEDARAELLAHLRDLIPAAFADGGALDREALLDALGLSDDDSAPAFAFSWPSIEMARVEARAATTATLRPDVDASVEWDTARDVLVEGDNLQVLKLLKKGYAGQIKLIYIDPPYNTGDSFTYNDDFAVPESEYLQATGQVDEQGNAMTSRLETSGRKHDPWLTMMFSRLTVARTLLRRDGVFLASIDNNEVHHLRLLLDAIFGPENFVDMMTWRGARKGDAKLTGGGQDYILVYARDRAFLQANDIKWRERKEGLEPVYAKVAELQTQYGADYDAASAALREWYRSLSDEDPSKAHAHYNKIDDLGVWFGDNITSPNFRENLRYTWKGYEPPENGWRYERETMEKLDSEGRLVYPEDKTKRVKIKFYLPMRETWAPASVFYRDRRAASTALDELMGVKVFDDPKSTDVLARLFHSMTDDGDIIVDFFAGSGSTGQAVWEQNPRDGKTRRWVLVQRPEKPDTSTESGKNAIKQGYATIFEVTAERLRRAALITPQADGSAPGIRVFRTTETNLVVESPIIASEGMSGQDLLTAAIDRAIKPPVKDDAVELDVAWEVVLKATNLQLDARVTVSDIGGVNVYEFARADSPEDGTRYLVSLGAFSLATADAIGLQDSDTLILRTDRISDDVTLTLAPRLQSKLILLERVPREVSL